MQIDYGKRDYGDDDFKAAIVHSLPEPYHAEKILLKDKYKTMDLQDMITILRGRFKELSTKDEKEEKALNANENLSLRITCYHCGKHGHKRYECPDKDDGKADKITPKWRFQGICRYCNKQGHRKNECFKKKADQKREREREQEQARVAEEEYDFDFEEEHVMTAFEDYDCDDFEDCDNCDEFDGDDESIVSEGPCKAPYKIKTKCAIDRCINDNEKKQARCKLHAKYTKYQIHQWQVDKTKSINDFGEMINNEGAKRTSTEVALAQAVDPQAVVSSEVYDVFIADTGATCHIKVDKKGLCNIRKVDKTVRMGSLKVRVIYEGDY